MPPTQAAPCPLSADVKRRLTFEARPFTDDEQLAHVRACPTLHACDGWDGLVICKHDEEFSAEREWCCRALLAREAGAYQAGVEAGRRDVPVGAEGLCECGHHASRHAIGWTCWYRTEGDPRFCRCSDFRPASKE